MLNLCNAQIYRFGQRQELCTQALGLLCLLRLFCNHLSLVACRYAGLWELQIKDTHR